MTAVPVYAFPTVTRNGVYRQLVWFLEPQKLEAVVCPHCHGEYRQYRQGLHQAHTRFIKILIDLGRPAVKKDVSHLSFNMYSTGHTAWKWGLIVSQSPTNRGPWVVTDTGHRFMDGVLALPLNSITFKGPTDDHAAVIRYEGPPIRIQDVKVVGSDIYEQAAHDKRTAHRRMMP